MRSSGEKSNSPRATSSDLRFGGGLLLLKEPDQSAGVMGSFFGFFKMSPKFGSFAFRGSKATRLGRGTSRATGSASTTRGASRGQELATAEFTEGLALSLGNALPMKAWTVNLGYHAGPRRGTERLKSGDV